MCADAARERIRVVIVDDEPLGRDCIRIAIESEPDMTVVAECADGLAAVDAIRLHRPDLVFLDVQMPGLSGFDVVERIGPERMPAVVFVTAYEQNALRAFEVHALDFVLKPFDDRRFREAVGHARRSLAERRDGELGRRLAALLSGRATTATAEYASRITVRDDDRVRFVRTDDVDYFEADGNHVLLHVGKEIHRVRATLTRIAARLDPAIFTRIHRSMVVNVTRIREVQPWFAGDYVAILNDGRQLRVSRAYRETLLRPMR